MSIPCPKCGTPLLGKVNRCWKCGTLLEAAETAPPPERFPTIRPGAQLISPALAGTALAGGEALPVVPVEDEEGTSLGSTAKAASSDANAGEGAAPVETVPERVGSPFAGPSRSARAAREVSTPSDSPASVPPPLQAVESPSTTLDRATRQQVSRAGAYGVWALAALALVGFFFTSIGAACVAFLGLTFGMWGLYSDRKTLALAGAAICLALFLFAGFFAATDLYIHAFGRSPWMPPPSPPPGP